MEDGKISLKMFNDYLRANRLNTEIATKKLKDETDKMHYDIPKDIKFPRPVKKRICGKMEIFESPGDGKSELILMYIHGGAYCYQFFPFHWKFLSYISERTGCAFTTPNYPLTPKYTWKESHSMVIDYYKEFIKNHDMSKVIIGGDSAGGAYALTLLQQAKSLGLSLPAKMFLLSPYVDITGAVDTDVDPILEYKGLLECGKAWANNLDLKDPKVSPFYGDMEGLPMTSLWVGTNEILYEEIIKTYEKMKDSGVEIKLHVGKDMVHTYPILPIKESDSAREEIAKFIMN